MHTVNRFYYMALAIMAAFVAAMAIGIALSGCSASVAY